MCSIRLPTESGIADYLDFDLDGTFDAHTKVTFSDNPSTDARILVGQTWVRVEDDTNFRKPPLKATTRDEPAVTYHFTDGAWVETP